MKQLFDIELLKSLMGANFESKQRFSSLLNTKPVPLSSKIGIFSIEIKKSKNLFD